MEIYMNGVTKAGFPWDTPGILGWAVINWSIPHISLWPVAGTVVDKYGRNPVAKSLASTGGKTSKHSNYSVVSWWWTLLCWYIHRVMGIESEIQWLEFVPSSLVPGLGFTYGEIWEKEEGVIWNKWIPTCDNKGSVKGNTTPVGRGQSWVKEKQREILNSFGQGPPWEAARLLLCECREGEWITEAESHLSFRNILAKYISHVRKRGAQAILELLQLIQTTNAESRSGADVTSVKG